MIRLSIVANHDQYSMAKQTRINNHADRDVAQTKEKAINETNQSMLQVIFSWLVTSFVDGVLCCFDWITLFMKTWRLWTVIERVSGFQRQKLPGYLSERGLWVAIAIFDIMLIFTIIITTDHYNHHLYPDLILRRINTTMFGVALRQWPCTWRCK